MKKVLITGINSYLGNQTADYLEKWNREKGGEYYRTEKISLKNPVFDEKEMDFGGYDVILQVAGIAHADTEKVTEEEKEAYYRVNCDLAVQTAKKAKRDGCRHFIYFSSVIVYGSGGKKGRGLITKETALTPDNFYGDSKKKAEEELQKLAEDGFEVAILRIPFVYGPGCKGNFNQLKKIAQKTPVFPDYPNERSMIYVENLAEFIRRLIDTGKGGIYFPQNETTVSTAHLVREIGASMGKRIRLWRGLNFLVRLAFSCPGKPGRLAGKAFGSLMVERSLSGVAGDSEAAGNSEVAENVGMTENVGMAGVSAMAGYQVCDFAESIRRSVNGKNDKTAKRKPMNGKS